MTFRLTPLAAILPLVVVIAGAAIYLKVQPEAETTTLSAPASAPALTAAPDFHPPPTHPLSAIVKSAAADRSVAPRASTPQMGNTASALVLVTPRAEVQTAPPAKGRESQGDAGAVRSLPGQPEANSFHPANQPTFSARINGGRGGVSNTPSAVPASNSTASAKPAPLPLALQGIDPVAAGFTPTQAKALDTLRDEFVKDIGGERQSPNDPAYAERWNEAQPKSDAQMRLFFGDGYANALALRAAQADYAAAHPQ